MKEKEDLKIRNICILAHVDHGKTTLANLITKKCLKEIALDSSVLESTRGITLLSKCVSMKYKDCTINIVDTPGHVELSYEVNKVLSLTEGVLLVIDSYDGLMPHSRYLIRLAMERNMDILIVINKIDRENCRPLEIIYDVSNLINKIDANYNKEIHYFLGSAKEEYFSEDLDILEKPKNELKDIGITSLLDGIINYIRSPIIVEDSFKMFVSIVDNVSYHGHTLTGVNRSNTPIKPGDELISKRPDGTPVEKFNVKKIFTFKGNVKDFTEKSFDPGMIGGVSGCKMTIIGDTIGFGNDFEPIKIGNISDPTMCLTFGINDSNYLKVPNRVNSINGITGRLVEEKERNIGISLHKGPTYVNIGALGELPFSVLIEDMKENYDFSVSAPSILFKTNEKGIKLEPIEETIIDLNLAYLNKVLEEISLRSGDVSEIKDLADDYKRVITNIPSRLSIGLGYRLSNLTKGSAIISKGEITYQKYDETKKINKTTGYLLALEDGKATSYSIDRLRDRGVFFVKPGDTVYTDQIIGFSNDDKDLGVNICIEKQKTNIRSATKSMKIVLPDTKVMDITQALIIVFSDASGSVNMYISNDGVTLKKDKK